MARTRRTKTIWHPVIGGLAQYVGNSTGIARRAGAVRVIGECRTGWMTVEAVDENGVFHRIQVKASSLAQRQPDLFEEMERRAALELYL